MKAICFEQSYLFPVYFFIQQTTETIGDTIDLLKGLDVRGIVRDKLIERLQMPQEKMAIGNLSSANSAAIERMTILNQLRSKSLNPNVIDDKRRRFFEALTHTNATEFDQDYIFRVLREYIEPRLNTIDGISRSYFRKAICHLDLIWYKSTIA